MISYSHVEDYLEILGGYSPQQLILPAQPKLINLANYDVSIVTNMASETIFGFPLTDRQGELAVKLVLKYRRQFASNGIDVSPIENPVYRRPLRHVNRDKKIWIDGDRIKIQFPYSKQLVSDIKQYYKFREGSMRYHDAKKEWEAGITESNVNWLCAWGQLNQFTIDPTLLEMFNLILSCEEVPYKIELIEQDGMYTITNAANSLITYVEENLNGFGLDNTLTLIDNAGKLGYTIDQSLFDKCITRYGTASALFSNHHKIYLAPSSENFEMILDNAALTNRYPIYIYDPLIFILNNDLNTPIIEQRFTPDQIIKLPSGKLSNCKYDVSNAKLIYTSKLPENWPHPIPLLITTQDMIFGGARIEWMTRAERIVNYCATKLKG